MNAVQILEFDRIRAQVADRATCARTVRELRMLLPETDPGRVAAQKRYVQAILSRIEAGVATPSGSVEEITPLFEQIAMDGAVVEPDGLLFVRRFLEYATAVLQYCRVEDAPVLNGLVGDVNVPVQLAKDLNTFVTDDGEISEAAIPELRRLKSEIGRVNRALIRRAEEMMRTDSEIYRGEEPTIRDGRTVLPLAANFKGRVDGIIHESSGSGETLFVEPRQLVDLNNELIQAHHAIHREIRRVLRELSADVRRELPLLRPLYDAVVTVDGYIARARWGAEHAGVIVKVGDHLDLRGARHPLLGAACVPLSVAFEEDTRMLVISGPNTGGKTVLIKTVGLLSMLHQCAVPVPAEADSTMPLFEYWGVDIGDEQSIDDNLSTFSAHMRRLATIIRDAGPESLVLLDELGSGTDPDEGAALSMAIVDFLIERGSTILVSTHQTMLKHYGYTREGARNVSMAFDQDTHQPTYRVVSGRPGSSHAIETAEDQGVVVEVIAAARAYAGDRENSVTEIINRLLVQEDELQRRVTDLAEREARFQTRETILTEREGELDTRERELRQGSIAELEQTIRDSRKRIEAEVRRLRERGSELDRTDIRRAHEQLESIESERDRQREKIDQLSRTPAPAEPTAPLTTIDAGQSVRHARTGKTGTVKSVRGDRVEVQFGALRMQVPREELTRTDTRTPGDGSGARFHRPRGGGATLELDIRGQRLHEALEALERQVDEALLQDLHSFSVIHGTGTGVLQKGVHDYLSKRPEVASFRFARPEDGGFGKTMVEISSDSG